MLSEAVERVTGIFDRRFLLNAFFPCLIFWGLLALAGAVGAGADPLLLLQKWNQQDELPKGLQLTGFITLTIFFANVVFTNTGRMVRFFEGYWHFPLSGFVSAIGKNRYHALFDQLDVKARLDEVGERRQQLETELSATQDEKTKRHLLKEDKQLLAKAKKLELGQHAVPERRYRYYPPGKYRDQIMPTRLGNILKSSEIYPYDRYGIDAVFMWPRLYYALPERFINVISEALSSLHFTLTIATLSGMFSIVSGTFLLAMKAPGWLFLLCFWGGVLVAWLAYCSAISGAVIYAEQVRTGFDLYRHELVKQLRMRPPRNPAQERQLWQETKQYLFEGIVPHRTTYREP